MATVYRAYDPMFEREVALKVLPHELLHDEQYRGRFEREAKIIAKLEHAAIVPVYDVGQEDDQPYFVMRYMAGGSLSDMMSAAPISLEETARIVQRVAAALDYAHSKGIIHRDLKPGNILFDENGDPFISDYGIAKLAQSQTNLTGSSIIGTPAYMSPEQAQGNDIDSRSDIYSLGVIVYEMLSTKPPFEANTPLGLVFKHVSEPVPHILDVNPRLPVATEAVLEKAMAKKPDDRFRTATDFALALEALARGETPDLNRTSPVATHYRVSVGKPAPSALPGPANNSRMWVIGGIVLLIVAAVVWGGMRFAASGTSLTPALAPSETSSVVSVVLPGELTATVTAPISATATAAAGSAGVGGADKIAAVSGNNIWIMGVDGSNPVQLTTDSKPKFDLQWLSDPNKFVYAEDKCAYIVDITTKKTVKAACFNGATYFESFRVSPDGKQVAISLDRLVFVVPFDLTALGQAHDRNALGAMKGCLTYRAVAAKNLLWSKDGQKLAVLYLLGQADGSVADTMRVIDIHACGSANPVVVDDFPAGHFVPESYTNNQQLPSVSWDGDSLFLFNTYKRNEGYGPLYTYDLSLEQENKINPIKGVCCYRDGRISPDGSYILFAFQDLSQGENSKTLVYYIPLADLGAGKTFEPIQFPGSFFADPREKPQFALRAAVP